MKSFSLGEMFSGPGGIALGAKYASEERRSPVAPTPITHAWALDYHPDTTSTFQRNFPELPAENLFTADIREFDLRILPAFDAFAFGFPCNDFSNVGRKKGLEGTYGPLYTYGIHAIAMNEPAWFLAENVTGISSANGGAAFGQILSALTHPSAAALSDPLFHERYPEQALALNSDLEYTLVAHRYRFEEYGVPQARHRVLIVGIRNDLDLSFRVPAPTGIIRTAGEAIDDPPIAPDAPNNEMTRHGQRVIDRLSLIDPGKNAFNSDFSSDPSVKLNVRGATLSNIYKRVDPTKPSYTVTGSGGGGTQMYHWSEPRGLTNRERARLQTFPDDFVFEGGILSVKRQIGMAVPPEGAKIIIGAILDTFAGVPYRSVEENINIDRYITRARSLDGALA